MMRFQGIISVTLFFDILFAPFIALIGFTWGCWVLLSLLPYHNGKLRQARSTLVFITSTHPAPAQCLTHNTFSISAGGNDQYMHWRRGHRQKQDPKSEGERSAHVPQTYPGWSQPHEMKPHQGRGQADSSNSEHKGQMRGEVQQWQGHTVNDCY